MKKEGFLKLVNIAIFLHFQKIKVLAEIKTLLFSLRNLG
jgi:hypothetical protein